MDQRGSDLLGFRRDWTNPWTNYSAARFERGRTYEAPLGLPVRKELEAALKSGRALDRFRRMVEAHGGDPRVVDDPRRLPTAPHRLPVLAPRGGFVVDVDARELGLVAVALGAGRTRADQKIDPAVGIELLVRPGDRVQARQPLAFLHVRRAADAAAEVDRTARAFRLGSKPPPVVPLVVERIGG